MKNRLATIVASFALLVAAAATSFSIGTPSPASAQGQQVCVIVGGQKVTIPLANLVPGQQTVPCVEVAPPNPVPAPAPPPGTDTTPAPAPSPAAPQPGSGSEQERGGSKKPADKDGAGKKKKARGKSKSKAEVEPEGGEDRKGRKGKRKKAADGIRNPDGSPTPSNPGFVDALPGPSSAQGVPNFVIRKFRVPVFLLPIYQAAGIQYGVRWEVLAAINEIETDYGRNLNVSSAGALGWMQFIPSSWRMYGVDANKDGKKDPYNPVDAIFAAARYLKAAGYEQDVRRSIFAYNHADWYVDSVMLRARLISGVPADLVGSLTGLTEGRFPVAARARYADDLQEAEATKRVKRGQNAANVVESKDDREDIDIFAKQGAPVVATNDGEIKKIGVSKTLGRYITLQDVYGNRYTYSGLGSTAKYYPVPKEDAADPKLSARAVKANGDDKDPKPTTSASAGRQPTKAGNERPKAKLRMKANKPATDDVEPAPAASVPIKERLFAHPDMPLSRENGGLDQLLDAKGSKGFETYANYFSRPFGANSKDVRLRRLKVGSRVIGGTILGRIGTNDDGKASHLTFGIRPAGKGAPKIDPKPILDGWKLLEATAVYRASGRNALYGDDSNSLSIGQVLLLPKPLLEKRVLSDNRIEIYPGGENDIKTGQIDRRVLATLAYLAESGLKPTVSSLKGNHGLMTASGNVSQHSSGNAVDIATHQQHPDPGPPGAGRDHRTDRSPRDAPPGDHGSRPGDQPARAWRPDLGDG